MTTTHPVPEQMGAGIRGASLVDRPPIIAGALIAMALVLLLTTFGAAIGLSVSSPWSGQGWNATTLGIGAETRRFRSPTTGS